MAKKEKPELTTTRKSKHIVGESSDRDSPAARVELALQLAKDAGPSNESRVTVEALGTLNSALAALNPPQQAFLAFEWFRSIDPSKITKEETEAVLRRGLSIHPASRLIRLALARTLSRWCDEANVEALSLISDIDLPEARWMTIELSIFQKNYSQAIQAMSLLPEQDSNLTPIVLVRAYLLIASGDFSGARTLINPITKRGLSRPLKIVAFALEAVSLVREGRFEDGWQSLVELADLHESKMTDLPDELYSESRIVLSDKSSVTPHLWPAIFDILNLVKATPELMARVLGNAKVNSVRIVLEARNSSYVPEATLVSLRDSLRSFPSPSAFSVIFDHFLFTNPYEALRAGLEDGSELLQLGILEFDNLVSQVVRSCVFSELEPAYVLQIHDLLFSYVSSVADDSVVATQIARCFGSFWGPMLKAHEMISKIEDAATLLIERCDVPAQVYSWAGWLKSKRGDRQGATKAFGAAVDVARENGLSGWDLAYPVGSLGLELERIGDLRGAADFFLEALVADPDILKKVKPQPETHAIVLADQAVRSVEARNLSLGNLTLRQRALLGALVRAAASEDLMSIGPISALDDPFAPTSWFETESLRELWLDGLIVPSPSSRPGSLTVADDGRLNVVLREATFLSALKPEDLGRLLVPERLDCDGGDEEVVQVEKLWMEIAAEEGVRYLEHLMIKKGHVKYRASEKTRASMRGAADRYSIAQLYYIVWKGVKDACARAHVDGGMNSKHFANFATQASFAFADRATAEKWVIRPFNRDRDLRDATMTTFVAHAFLAISTNWFTMLPKPGEANLRRDCAERVQPIGVDGTRQILKF